MVVVVGGDAADGDINRDDVGGCDVTAGSVVWIRGTVSGPVLTIAA